MPAPTVGGVGRGRVADPGGVRQHRAMDDIAARYDRLAAAFAAKVAAVPDDRWDAPSPCPDWSARDVVRHVVDAHGMFVGFIDEHLPDGPDVDTDPTAAFAGASATVLALVTDPASRERTYVGHLGERTFGWAVDRFLSFDLAVHGWDLARATGQDDTIDPDEIDRLRTDAEAFGDAARAPGVFGDEVTLPDGASPQDRLLAFVGRDPR